MHRIFFAAFLFLIMTSAFAQTDWKLKNEKNGIKVYIGSVSDSKYKAIKVECEMNATTSQLVAVLLDIKTGPEWVDHTKSCTLLKQVSPSELYYYSEVNIPWPAQNRDFVAHLTVHQDPVTKVVTVDGPSVTGFVPAKKGIVRVQSSKGLWIITPLKKDLVRVVYTLHVDPGGDIPAWLVNLLATQGPMKSFEGLIAQIKKPAFRNVTLPFIKD